MSKLAPASTYRARALAAAGSLAIISSLIGCGIGMSNVTSTPASSGPGTIKLVQGHVHGGQQPVSGATIQLYTAGTTGYGTGSTALGSSSVTDANGAFNITSNYTCTPGTQVYAVVTGGNPGLSPPSVNNQFISLMAAIGTCPVGGTFAPTIPNLVINEVTTVAAVWALQNFMAAPTGSAFVPAIGAPSTTYSNGLTSPTSFASAQIGMANAFVTAKVLADISTGYSPNTNYPYATPETAKINLVANILATCINTDPNTTSNCSNLLTAGTTGATPTGAPNATDTVQAAWYIAQNPINNVTTLCQLPGATPPFQPASACVTAVGPPPTTAIKDYTIAVNYAPTFVPPAGGAAVAALNSPFSLTIDAYGNVYADSISGTSTTGVEELGVDGSLIMAPVLGFTASLTNGSASQFTGAPPTAARVFASPKHMAVDLANQAWVANGDVASGTVGATTTTTGDVAVFNPSPSAGTGGLPLVAGVSGTNPTGGTIKGGFFVGLTPYAIVIDPSNNVFVDNTGSPGAAVLDGASVSKMANDGTNYIFSTSANATSPTAPLRTPGAQGLMALDNNTTVTGGPDGIVWTSSSQACNIAGAVGNATTKWGAEDMFNGNNLTPLTAADIASAYSNATVGAGSASNCGSSSTFVGQVITAGTANVSGLAIDRTNGVWLTNEITSSTGFDGLTYLVAPTASTGVIPASYNIFDFNATAPAAGTAPTISGTTFRKSSQVAVDGNNRAWVLSNTLTSVAEVAINPANGTPTYFTPGLNASSSAVGFLHNISNASNGNIAIDPSGNVWVTNSSGANSYTNQSGGTTATNTSLTVLVGAAAPVITPQALALKVGKIGQKP